MNRQFAHRRSASWIPAEHASGRKAAREGVYGKIVGRACVGFGEEDWQFILWLAKEFDRTISEAVREIITQNRVGTEKELADEGFTIPWKE